MAQHSGWYDDPFDPALLRYWDGVLWTDRTTPKVLPTAQPPMTGPGGPAAGQVAASGSPTQGATQAGPPPGYLPPAPYGQQGGYGAQGGYGQPYGQQGGYGPQAPYGQQMPQWQGGPWARTGPVAPDGTPLAAWWQRLLARIIDSIVTSTLAVVLAWPWVSDLWTQFKGVMTWVTANPGASQSAIDARVQDFAQQVAGEVVPWVLIALGVQLAYEVIFLIVAGATPGKFLLGIRVRPMDRPGPPNLVGALRRQVIWVAMTAFGLVPFIGGLGSIVVLLDYLWLLWDGRRQCLHDKVADTVVVKNV